jgi:hypothetical protein
MAGWFGVSHFLRRPAARISDAILFQFDEKNQIVTLNRERTSQVRVRCGRAVIRRNRSSNKFCAIEHTNVILVCERV